MFLLDLLGCGSLDTGELFSGTWLVAGGLAAADALLLHFAGFAPLVLPFHAIQGPALGG